MNSDLNPERPSSYAMDRPPDGQPDTLAQAFEDLMRVGSARIKGMESVVYDAALRAERGSCPEADVWLQFANGDATSPGAEEMLAHAAACGGCAKRLRQSLLLLEAEASAEELAEVASLTAASDEWKMRIAVELARTRQRASRGRPTSWYLWAGAGLAASLSLAIGAAVWWQRIHTPERLLAEAYTHARIFPLRIPGASFAEVTPPTHLRGSGSGREASSLLDARAQIERHLENEPDSPHWLQLEARADLLEEKFDPAIDILDRLVATGPATADLLTDDAAAYFQRGSATGSDNDRATALEDLRRADTLNPGDPVVLFNEAVVMEDRGEVMNAVETWGRYLRFERDPRWLAEGRHRLQALEEKLNRLKTHQSRMEQYLATPQSMRALAADGAALAAVDEELSTSLLPRLLIAAFPLPVDRSRGSPCDANCLSARELLRALAASLERNHQDPWLTKFLPSPAAPPSDQFLEAAHTLGQAIGADVAGDYAHGKQWALMGRSLFHRLGNAAGEDRATVEQAYALQILSDVPGCYRAVHPLLARNPEFAWIQIQGFTEDSACDPAPGTSGENNPAFVRAVSLAHERHYTLLELRARNWLGASAVDNGDVENSWHIYLGTVQRFWSGDFPSYRLYSTLSGLEEIEETTPRVQNTLLLQREALSALEMSQNRGMIPAERMHLAAVAIRAGDVREAQELMGKARTELAASGGGNSVRAFLAEDESAMASVYLDRGDLAGADKMLEAMQGHMAGENNSFHRRDYALNRGRLELAQGHPDTAESLLRAAVIEEERLGAKGGTESITLAQQDRETYAVLAGVWLAQGRPGEDVLALWERYRMRILGKRVLACENKGLACLRPGLEAALQHLGTGRVLGQLVLFDRVLLFQAGGKGVRWSSIPVGRAELLEDVAPLERAASSRATSQASVDWAARRAGKLLLDGLGEQPQDGGTLLIEPDPLLGNLPWPAVEADGGPIGLRFNLEEMPSLLLAPRLAVPVAPGSGPLIVGASVAAGPEDASAGPGQHATSQESLLPEVLDEARPVARFGRNPSLLLAGQATEAQVTQRLATAPAIHFAGHAAQQEGATRLLLAAASDGKPYLDGDLLRKHPPRAARLAVFSACSSGKREEGWNHGMGDIVNTLAALGVPDVVATRWQIDSAAAVPMMDAFYSGLAQGLTVPQALTAARQSLIRDGRYRHPYYWAAYYASGSGNTTLSQVFHPAK
jgi:tetratricopeptide (TPR) repeat protein